MIKLNLGLILKAARANFLPASIIPFLLGTVYAFSEGFGISGARFTFGFLGVISVHLAGNLCNDYFDHKSEADRHNRTRSPFFGGSGFIQEGAYSAKTILAFSVIFFLAAVLCGIGIFIITKNPVFLLMMVIGGVLTVEYTAGPLRLSYRKLGEIDIFLLFGAFLVMGSFYLFAETFTLDSFFISLPIAFLIASVILCNEIPDFDSDMEVNKKNLISFFGKERGYVPYGFSIGLSLAAVFLNVLLGNLPAFSVAIVIFYLLGLKAILILKENLHGIQDFIRASALTIMLHSLAGIAIVVVIYLGTWI